MIIRLDYCPDKNEQFRNITITDEELSGLYEEDEEKEMAYNRTRQTKENVGLM